MGILSACLKFIPLILTLIPGVEGLFSKGTDKKAAVMTSATGILGILQATGVVTADQAAKFPDATSEFVDAVVKFLNAVGAFPAATK